MQESTSPPVQRTAGKSSKLKRDRKRRVLGKFNTRSDLANYVYQRPDWTQGRLALHAGVSVRTIARIRKETTL